MNSDIRGPWLYSKNFDLIFFILPGLYLFLCYLPFFAFGEQYVSSFYYAHLVLFSYPHIFFMWASISSDVNGDRLSVTPVIGFVFVSILMFLGLALLKEKSHRELIGGMITWLGIFHIFMQHLGILKIYNRVQSKRGTDGPDGKEAFLMGLAFTLLANLGIVASFTSTTFQYEVFPGLMYSLPRPTIPKWGFLIYLLICVIVTMVLVYQVILKRLFRKAPLPVPQLLMILIIPLGRFLPYLFVPESSYSLIVLVGIIFHDIQYMGFVWGYEKHKLNIFAEEGIRVSPFQKFVQGDRWKTVTLGYFALAGVMAIGIVYLGPVWGFALFSGSSVSHYLVDGVIWKHKHNKNMKGFTSRLVGLRGNQLGKASP